MYLTKTAKGDFIPTYNSDRDSANKVPVGGEVYATQARNVGHHRKGFALLKLGFENQDKYDNFEIYRQIITIKAGFVHWVDGKDGIKYPLPQSLSFEKMNQEDFNKWYESIREVISKEASITGAAIDEELESFY